MAVKCTPKFGRSKWLIVLTRPAPARQDAPFRDKAADARTLAGIFNGC
jgi:hypothetical protein